MYEADGETKKYSGQIDNLNIWKSLDRLLIVDFKMLRGDTTPAVSNWQGRTLALLASRRYGASEVIFVLIQPWKSPQIDEVIYRQADLEEAERAIDEVIAASKEVGAPRHPGQPQCNHCAAVHCCPEALTAGLAVSLYKTDMMSPGALLARAQAYQLIEKIIEEDKANMKRILEADPTAIPGLTLQATGHTRKITNMELAKELLSAYFSEEEWTRLTSLKIGDAEEAFGKALGLSEEEAKGAFNDLLVSCMATYPKAKSLRVLKKR